MICILLAGGKGTRLLSELPKPLVEIEGTPMVVHVYREVKKALGDVPFCCVIPPGSQDVFSRAFGAENHITFATQPQPLGPAHALLCGLQQLDLQQPSHSDALVMYADLVCVSSATLSELVGFYRKQRADMVLLSGKTPRQYPYALLHRSPQGALTAVEEKGIPRTPAPWEYAIGPLVLKSKQALQDLQTLQPTPPLEEVYMADLANRWITAGRKVDAVATRNENEFLGVNTPADLEEAAGILRERANQEGDPKR